MKKVLLFAIAGLLFFGMTVGLVEVVAQLRSNTYIVLLRQKANLNLLRGNRTAVKRTLMTIAQRTQAPLLARLEQWKRDGKVKGYRSIWIVNAITVVQPNPEVIEALKRDPNVEAIEVARPVRLIEPVRRQNVRPMQAFTWGLEKIRVPDAWNAFGVQGANVTVGVIDTGIDPTHPDLAGKLRPQNGWFDPYDPGSSPSDWEGHGTHVSGTIAGGNASGISIGVAPQATLIVAQLFDEDASPTLAEVLACMQWMLDPDGDPNTDDGADVVNNSWGDYPSHSPDMFPPIQDALNAWVAANIFPAFAIGNSGPAPQTTGSPGDYPMAFGVGATDSTDTIADFSSRGPVFWSGIGEIIKPDVSAPGVAVYSSVPGGWEAWDGTSMACPHVVGTVALVLSFAQQQGIILDVETIKNLLKNSAVDLGAQGPDNDYGWGRIDAFATILPLAPDPNEPNDTPDQATPLAFGETKSGKIEPNGDGDFFKFVGTNNTVITVDINAQSIGSEIDAVLQLLDSDGTTVLKESDDVNGNLDPLLPKFILPHDGEFFLKVTAKPTGAQLRFYTITLKLRSVPNLTATFDAENNQVILQWGSVFNTNSLRRQARRNPLIRPLDLQGYRVYRATSSQGPFDLIADVPANQTSYIDAALPPDSLLLFYRVTALYDEGESEPTQVFVLTEPEPNDTPAQATPIAYGQSKRALIFPAGDVDFYKFDGQTGDLVTVRVDAMAEGSALDSVLTLYNSDGQTVLAFNDDFADWRPITFDSRLIRFPLPHDGTFYLKVKDFFGSGSENHFYTLTLIKDVPDDHGDWAANATQIADGQSVDGVINPPPDIDYFAFEANAGDFMSAEIFAERKDPPSALDSMLALYDEQGNLLALNNDWYGLDSAILDFQLPQTGRYFLVVMPFGGPDVGSPDHFYTLTLQILSGPKIAVTPESIDQTLPQGEKTDVLVNVSNTGEMPLTFLTRAATSALTVQRFTPSLRKVMVVPEKSKLYQEYLSKQNLRQKWQALFSRKRITPRPFMFVPDPNKEYRIDLIPLKGGRPIGTLQAQQPPTGTWRWIVVDPDEFNGTARNVRKVFIQSDGTRLYFRAELAGGDFNPDDSFFDTFLDTDRNAATGAPWLVSGMGVDYILYGGLGTVGVFRFNPATGGFDFVADLVWFTSANGAVEVGANLADLGNPIDFHAAFSFYDSLADASDSMPDIWYAPVTRDVFWLERSPVTGSLLGSEGVDLTVTLDATSLNRGNHRANLVFNSNDSGKPQVIVPITLTVVQPPSVPELVSPSEGEIVRPTLTFKVKATDPDGDQVKFVIEASKGETTKTFETNFVASGDEASFTVPSEQALQAGVWSWKAKAIDDKGQESDFSASRNFVVNQPPNRPDLISPASLVSPTPTFKLKATDPDGDKVKFKIVVKQDGRIVSVFDQTQDATGWNKVEYESGEEATFVVPSSMALESGDYLWLAYAYDGKEWSEESETRTLTVNQPANVPELVSPSDGAIVRPTPTFKVKAIDPDGDQVKFFIEARKGETTKTFETNFFASGDEASFTVPSEQALQAGVWSWKAKAIDDRGQESAFSASRNFIVNQPPNRPDLISPASLVSPTPTFQLKATDPDGDKVKFKIVVKQDGQIVSVFDQTQDETGWDKAEYESGEVATFVVPSNMALESGDYLWLAYAFDGKEWSEESETRTLTVNQPANVPELVSPSDGAIVRPTPTFKVKAIDPDGDQVKFFIEARKGETTKTFETNFFASGDEASFTVPSEQALEPGEWAWKAKAIDSHGQESLFSAQRNFIVNRRPTAPVLLRPDADAVTKPTTTFRITAMDDDVGDTLKFKIVVKQDGKIVAVFDQTQDETGWVSDSSESETKKVVVANFTVPSNRALVAGKYQWQAFAYDGKEWSDASETRSFDVNQAPTPPELVLPVNNAITSATPTFQMVATDLDANSRLKYKVVIKRGEQVVAEFDQTKETKDATGWDKSDYGAGEIARFLTPTEKALSPGIYQWQAFSYDGKEWSEGSLQRNFEVSAVIPSRIAGIGTFALSLQVEDMTKEGLGLADVPMKTWNASTKRYEDVRASLELGRGYWFKATQELIVRIAGTDFDRPEFRIPLAAGWNFVSSPYKRPIRWDALRIGKTIGDQNPMTLAEAAQGGWTEDYGWVWEQDETQPGQGSYALLVDLAIPNVRSELPSFKGVWFYAHKPCFLILPQPSQNKTAPSRRKAQGSNINGWAMRLQATINGAKGEAMLGVAQGSRGLSVGLPPEPPEGTSSVQVVVLKGNTPLAVDVRSGMKQRQEWDVLVRFGTRDGRRGTRQNEVMLSWDGVGYAPRDVSLTLVDMATGTKRYMRTQTIYRFIPQEGETSRKFKIIAELGNTRPLRIVGLKAIPTRGQGIIVQFSLTKPAQVQAEVLTLTGRRISALEVPRFSDSLTHRLIWRGIGFDGQRVGMGVYLVRVQAIDEEGRQVQATTMVRMN